MLTIPIEIRREIYDQVSFKDLVNLRLTCKTIFKDLSQLFEEIHQLVSCFDREIRQVWRFVTGDVYRTEINPLGNALLEHDLHSLFLCVRKEKDWQGRLFVAKFPALLSYNSNPSLEKMKRALTINWDFHSKLPIEEGWREVEQSLAILWLRIEQKSLTAVKDEMDRQLRMAGGMTTIGITYVEKLVPFSDPEMPLTLRRPFSLALNFWHDRNNRFPEKRRKIYFSHIDLS